jgi:hypothetical protein
MLALRILAGLFFLFAGIALAADVTRTLGSSTGLVITSFLAHWKNFAPQLLATAQQGISRNIHPLLWDPVLARLLLLPAWFLLGSLGLLCAHLGRRQRRVNIFIN